MKNTTLQNIFDHAEQCYPLECCGVVIVLRGKEKYVPCKNMSIKPDHFVMDPDDYALAEDMGEVTTIVHSHCNLSPLPTQPDLVSCEKTGKPWFIVSWPTKQTHYFEPSGYRAPLIGREFHHGILDCYSLCRDYYQEVLNITLADYYREDDWWLNGENHYLNYLEEVGFVRVDPSTLREHDGLLMQVASPVPNHAAVYIGDNKIIQHIMHRLSSRDVYGGWYRKTTIAVIRYKDFL